MLRRGMMSAVASVTYTMGLMLGITYTFASAIRNLVPGGSELEEAYFISVSAQLTQQKITPASDRKQDHLRALCRVHASAKDQRFSTDPGKTRSGQFGSILKPLWLHHPVSETWDEVCTRSSPFNVFPYIFCR